MNNKMTEKITPRDVDYAQWYTDVVKIARLCDYTDVKGCMIYLPNGQAIWENIQNNIDKMFKETGVQNVYLPMLIPESLLQKEKDHIAGFAPEVAWVTIGGNEELEERMCIRPTSETLFCNYWQKEVKSYRDLPKIYNQWCSVLRWEKTTRPYLRSREFLWQEGHTIHSTSKEAMERTLQMLDVYTTFCKDYLAIPMVTGQKTPSEKFAGAENTYTMEAMMHDGKALQSGTTHYFGQGFAEAFNIKFLNKENKLETVYETSWGISTRLIGALIMVHGDDNGLVLPPKIAPVQVIIVPIASHKEGVMEISNEIYEDLKAKGIRVKLDDSDKTPGFKFNESEVQGIPLRIEVGPRDLENGEVTLAVRFTHEKEVVKLENVCDEVTSKLEVIQKGMLEKATQFVNSHIYEAKTMDEMIEIAGTKEGFIKADWCGEEECEDKIKELTGGAGSRCIPFEDKLLTGKCICCGKDAKHNVIWGKSY